mgnify:CR=1 FL=1|tara:strand:+ start:1163 stop:1954 length:792 start_codon:yes stop_codon:yes gene_type:complete
MKRLIFTLLYKDGYFILSRNFRHQIVGKLSWVFKNYNLEEVTNFIDEIIIIDISKKKKKSEFYNVVNKISQKTFIPLVVGGGIETMEDVENILKNGGDKILINSLFYSNPEICKQISNRYGRQFLMASIDYSFDKEFKLYIPKDKNFVKTDIKKHFNSVIANGAGEILLQSIDNDGTGNGLDYKILNALKARSMPIILMGGVGNHTHITKGFRLKHCDAVATANLFNFVANEFELVRKKLQKIFKMPKKNKQKIQILKNNFLN